MTDSEKFIEIKKKMANACQNKAMKAYRRYGKDYCQLHKKLNLVVPDWLDLAFGRNFIK